MPEPPVARFIDLIVSPFLLGVSESLEGTKMKMKIKPIIPTDLPFRLVLRVNFWSGVVNVESFPK